MIYQLEQYQRKIDSDSELGMVICRIDNLHNPNIFNIYTLRMFLIEFRQQEKALQKLKQNKQEIQKLIDDYTLDNQ